MAEPQPQGDQSQTQQPQQQPPSPASPGAGPPKKPVKIGEVYVVPELCIAALACTVVAPKVFKMNEENKAYVDDRHGADDATILAAAQSCPTNAIIVKDEQGNQIYP